jgi:pyrroloquinoline-quinone synthase
MTEQTFLQQLDAIVEAGHLLKHPFYQQWNEGTLSAEALREYAQEYYLLVHHFPTYVSATHAACDDIEVRRMLLENLQEEEGGDVHHPELWLRFADALGAERQPLHARRYLPQTLEAVQTLRRLSRSEAPQCGLASLYAYESQIPSVATTKIDGLRRHYGVTSDEGLSFFHVHQKADRVHSAVTRAALQKLCDTDGRRAEALEAAREAVGALNLLLDGVVQAYCQTAAA